MAITDDENRQYDLLQPDIINKLQDRSFFIKAVVSNYALAAQQVGLAPLCSERRTSEAYFYWQSDIKRTLSEGIEATTVELDHFKHAAFIPFWLRRVIPINEIRVELPQGEDKSSLRYQRRIRYYKFGNELSSFLIGYKICANYEAGRIYAADSKVKPIITRLDYLKSLHLRDEFLDDFLMLIKHKSMSPYSVYMMYRSLFSKI